MGIWKQGETGVAVRRALTSVALFAQLLLLLTPLIDLPDGGVGHRALSTASTGAAFTSGQSDHTPQHNPTTCPACIAQSLHAQLASGVQLPTVIMSERETPDLRTSTLPHHDPPSSHHSRAPPVLS